MIPEINRAKKDIEKGKKRFTQTAGVPFGYIRYETQNLQNFGYQNGLVFDFDMTGCDVFQGQTQGCYGDYMDKVIIEKFGSEFKGNLHARADSLFLAKANTKNKTVALLGLRLNDQDYQVN